MSESKYLTRIHNLGLWNFLRYKFHKSTKLPRSGEFRLHSRFARFPLVCRAGSSDLDVFSHIYVLREYADLKYSESAELIIDCGANAGFSTTYFLNQFPQSHVIAVEPDPANFEMLKRNVAPYGNRCTTLQAGVWSRAAGLCIMDAPFGDGREWARGVREAKPTEKPDISAVEIGELLEHSPHSRISILKIDIEGSELEVFSASNRAWLDKVDCIFIELHGEDCERAYLEAVTTAGFQSKPCGGLTLSTRTPGTRSS